MRAFLTPAEQLVVRDASPADAVLLWHQLRRLYTTHRGLDPSAPAADAIPATIHTDAIDLVNAFEKLIAPIAPLTIAVDHGALWLAWRRAYARVFQVVGDAPNLRARFADNRALWLGMLEPFARRLAALASPTPLARRA